MLKAKIRLSDNRVVAASTDPNEPAVRMEEGFAIVDAPNDLGIFGANPELRFNPATGAFEVNPNYVPETTPPLPG